MQFRHSLLPRVNPVAGLSVFGFLENAPNSRYLHISSFAVSAFQAATFDRCSVRGLVLLWSFMVLFLSYDVLCGVVLVLVVWLCDLFLFLRFRRAAVSGETAVRALRGELPLLEKLLVTSTAKTKQIEVRSYVYI